MEVEHANGTLVFSTTRAASLNVIAREASIRPVADTRTVAQIAVTGRKELRICAGRGALQFSYRGETEMIGEGEAFRVILDPMDEDPHKKVPVKARRNRRTFLLIAISAAAMGAAVGVYESHRHKKIESPDRP